MTEHSGLFIYRPWISVPRVRIVFWSSLRPKSGYWEENCLFFRLMFTSRRAEVVEMSWTYGAMWQCNVEQWDNNTWQCLHFQSIWGHTAFYIQGFTLKIEINYSTYQGYLHLLNYFKFYHQNYLRFCLMLNLKLQSVQRLNHCTNSRQIYGRKNKSLGWGSWLLYFRTVLH